MAELNDIKINLAELRKNIAALQKDGYEDIGLEDLLKYIHATTRKPIPITQLAFGNGIVNPLREGGDKRVS